jgi:biotin-(acetyl-CoA carboxylase) ligase
LSLPPPYALTTLREGGDAFAHACRHADRLGAGSLVWVNRFDVAEFAVVLAPEEPLASARRAFFAGMSALGDAIAFHAPPEKPLTFDWPDAIRIDGGLIGGGRLGWPGGAAEDAVPAWLVFAATVRLWRMEAGEPGVTPLLTALDEEGVEFPDAASLIESAARHLMSHFDSWQAHGFDAVGRAYLERLAVRKAGERRRIDANGDLLLQGYAATAAERAPLVPALSRPAWIEAFGA